LPVTPVDTAPPPAPPAAVESIIVTAARLPPPPGDAAFSIIQLTPQQLQSEPRLDVALGQVPGVGLFRRTSSAAENPTTQGISLRQIGPSAASRALVTLDGVPQNDPFGGWVIWTQLPPESLEGAQVVRGAGAGPYGSGALTGVIALDELSQPGAVVADISGGSLGSARAAGATDQPLGPGSLFLSAQADHTDGWIPVIYGAGPADDKLSLTDESGAARWQVPIGRALMAIHVGAYEETRSAGLVGANSQATGEDTSVTVTAQPDADQLGYRLQAWFRHSDLSNTSVSTPTSRAYTTPANDQYATPSNGWGGNGALRGQVGDLFWETGADIRGASGQDEELFSYVGSAYTKNRLAGGDELITGGYVEATWQSGPWLITGGGRLDGWWTTSGHRIETAIATGAVTYEQLPPNRAGDVPSGRLAIKRDLFDGVYARLAGYTGFRVPTLNELYRPFRVGNQVTEANPALTPERLVGVEGGLGGHEGGLVWDVTGFYNRLENAVTNVTVFTGPGLDPAFPDAGTLPAGGSILQRQNAGTINAEGVEADASYAVTSRLNLRAAMDYTHSVVNGGTAAPQLTGLQPAQAPRFTLTAGFDWNAISKLTLHGDVRYESTRFDDDLNTHPLSPGATVNGRLDWAFNSETKIYIEADNLFDTRIETADTSGVFDYDEPRVVMVGISFRH
jgi:outer membrane receptor protein involved in Fe transport